MSEPAATHDGFGPIASQPLTRIQQIGAARLHAAWTQIPHVTHHEDADVSALEQRRRELAADAGRPTLLAWLARAVVLALRAHPRFCASLDLPARRLVLKQYVNLGFAVDTPQGLVVAVLHGADRPVADLGHAIADLAARARAGRLQPTEMEGSCFTISSLGSLGGTGFTPIINAPDVAILGAAQARVRPEWIDGQAVPRTILPLSLSYDHRAIDGAEAARFCTLLRELLAAPERLES